MIKGSVHLRLACNLKWPRILITRGGAVRPINRSVHTHRTAIPGDNRDESGASTLTTRPPSSPSASPYKITRDSCTHRSRIHHHDGPATDYAGITAGVLLAAGSGSPVYCTENCLGLAEGYRVLGC